MLKHVGISLLLYSAFCGFKVGPINAQELDKWIIGYYTSWSIYARDYHLSDVPIDQITHINYAFANIEDGEIILGDPYADVDRFYPGDSWDQDSLRGCFHQLQLLKAEHPHIKTLISVGGWTWSRYFSDVALTEESRSTFARSCLEFIDEYHFDGVDIDWEYPVSGGMPGNRYRNEDRGNFTLLLAELREQLNILGEENDREYLLTIAAPANPEIIENIEVDRIHRYLDWINVMTYDFHGPWQGDADRVTNFNSPLHSAPDDPLDEPFHSTFNLEAAIETYLDLGVPTEKLNPGLAFYGRGYGDVRNQNNGLFAQYSGAAPVGTWENGVFDYWDLEEHYIDVNGYISYLHNEAIVPWVYNPDMRIMISYDDSASIAEKGRFINDNELGGAMFWELSSDRDGVLLASIYHVLTNPSSVERGGDSKGLPIEFAIEAAYPNPFNQTATIRFCMPRAGTVCLVVHDLSGREVTVLQQGNMPAGWHSLAWDASDCSTGIYIVRLTAPESVSTRKMMLIR